MYFTNEQRAWLLTRKDAMELYARTGKHQLPRTDLERILAVFRAQVDPNRSQVLTCARCQHELIADVLKAFYKDSEEMTTLADDVAVVQKKNENKPKSKTKSKSKKS